MFLRVDHSIRQVTAAFLALAVTGTAGPVAAQGPERLMAGDSIQLRVGALERILRGLSSDERGPIVWVVPHRERNLDTGETRDLHLSDTEVAGLLEAFPTVRRAESLESVMECPPGVRVGMPGRGCPIRDDGVVVRFSRFRVDGDSIRTSVDLVRSVARGDGHIAWTEGLELVFRWVEGVWNLKGIRGRRIT